MRFRFIHAEKATYPLGLLCRVLKVSRKGYYAWRSRGEATDRDHSALDTAIKKVHQDNSRRLGTRRMVTDLAKIGVRVSRNTVRTRMAALDLKVRYYRAFRVTTKSEADADFEPNRLHRDFHRNQPNQAWVGDITYVKTCSGFQYLATVIDLHSRMVVGWSMKPHMRSSLVEDALNMALGRRETKPGLIFHSDRGSQYTSTSFRQVCKDAGIIQSMSRKGNCWDNAVSESFFATIDRELLCDGRSWTPERSRLEVFTYIETYYNRRRSHSTLGYLSPSEFERKATRLPDMALVA